MEMRVKHLEKMGEVAKAVVLAKACTDCSFIPNQATFRQTYVSLLCHLLPNEEAIMEVCMFRTLYQNQYRNKMDVDDSCQTG